MSVIEFKKLSSKLLKVSKIETLSGCGTKEHSKQKDGINFWFFD